MVKRISASVGKKGKNSAADVTTVQQLLNPFAGKAGFSKLKVDGTPTPQLNKAIGQFQLKICGFRPDYLVEPGRTTIKKLSAGPSKVAAEKKAEEKKGQKIKEDTKTKVLKAAKDAAMKEAKTQSLDKNSWAALLKEVEDYATDLYEKYFKSSEKKGEPPEKAAPKIASIVTKQTQKKAVCEKVTELKQQETSTPGKLTGKIQGVNKQVLNVLREVSSFYGVPIHVVSGLRDKKGQARAMFAGWNSHLDRGNIYLYLRKNKKLREELDAFVQNKQRDEFVQHMLKHADWKRVSRHLSGDAADVTTRTDRKIIAAIATCLKYIPERNSEGIKCHHFDNRKVVWPISDTVKAKWKK
ncbi:MAG: peptidoglycan-binding protein [Ruegeria sp.]|uniref:peptidoglycan-binding domain-containing protein n=1 Tax=Ruegeria sp. TaxID=1879320 RepID=UPI00349E4E49